MLFYFLVIRKNYNQAFACIGHIAILTPNKPHHHAVEILSGTHLKVEKHQYFLRSDLLLYNEIHLMLDSKFHNVRLLTLDFNLTATSSLLIFTLKYAPW